MEWIQNSELTKHRTQNSETTKQRNYKTAQNKLRGPNGIYRGTMGQSNARQHHKHTKSKRRQHAIDSYKNN